MELSADYLREKLQRDLEAEHVEVEDTTPGRCATSFRVLVVSAKFEGKPLLHRHRNVAHDPWSVEPRGPPPRRQPAVSRLQAGECVPSRRAPAHPCL
ncbi:bolA-like protein 2 isoform X2 [Marmota marmota marmota]|uniref:bolA-like protein 2 isoform X2 n=1 Tax=Marmota marmota marmota TaxID=9994 RepID=UPI002093890C|nr:bolA-like protein 2 isoform X2 [Marmota marmota marmota]